jgi:hypothetical protein
MAPTAQTRTIIIAIKVIIYLKNGVKGYGSGV